MPLALSAHAWQLLIVRKAKQKKKKKKKKKKKLENSDSGVDDAEPLQKPAVQCRPPTATACQPDNTHDFFVLTTPRHTTRRP